MTEKKLMIRASSWHLAQVLYARLHVAKMTLAKIAELNWEIMLYPPYSPDLSLTDFHLFLSLDNHMKNRTFNIEDDLKTETHNFFQSRTKDFYKKFLFCFLFYLPYLSSIHEKANCIAILWTGSPHSLGSCLFRGLRATCLPHKGGAAR